MPRVGRPKLPPRAYSQMRIERVLYEKIKIIAARESRSANAQIEYYCQQGVAAYERSNGTIEVEPEETE